ncbi:condensation domain-containing protein [Streptomyces sp. NPDC102402]|uniref:condensation domain-containing protein n=1 Tax=Streptomyces sp. NPDC102402 TaxID=3366169 RepID=UPI0038007DCE
MLTSECHQVPFGGGERRPPAPLTWSQQYYLAELDAARPQGCSLAITRVYALRPGTSRQAVADALAGLLLRFEGLRTTVRREGDSALLRVHTRGALPLAVHRAGHGAEADRETAGVATALAAAPFDVTEELPVRAALVEGAGAPHSLVLVFSHVAVDAFALRPVTDHLVSTVALRHPDWPPARAGEPGVHPYEQAAAEASAAGLKRAGRALRHASEVFLTMPAAPRTADDCRPGERFAFLSHRSPALDLALGAVALRTAEPVSTVLAAAMLAVDAVMADHTDGYVQLLSANRSRPGSVNAVVPYSQPVPCGVTVSGASFTELVRRTATATLGALRFGSYPPAGLAEVRREAELRRGAALDVSPTFNYRGRPGALPRRRVTGDELARAADGARTSWDSGGLRWRSTRYLSADTGEAGIRLTLQVDTAAHTPEWAEAWMSALERLVCAAAVGDVSPAGLVRVVEQSEARSQ